MTDTPQFLSTPQIYVWEFKGVHPEDGEVTGDVRSPVVGWQWDGRHDVAQPLVLNPLSPGEARPVSSLAAHVKMILRQRYPQLTDVTVSKQGVVTLSS